jgi:TetR/AcrR family transcriptional regulator
MVTARSSRKSSTSAGSAGDFTTRTRLLHAATECFAEFGYEGTSTREIANRANVAQQLITYHFGSKERLWKASVDYLHQEFLQTMDGLHFDSSGDLKAQFAEHQRTVFEDRLLRPYMARIWTHEFLSGAQRFSRVIAPMLGDFAETVLDPYFAEVVDRGIISRFSAGEATLICSALLQLNVLNPFFVEGALGKPADSREAVRSQIDLLLRLLTEPVQTRPDGATTDREHRGGDTGPAHETAELKQTIAELAIENRRLRRRLEVLESRPHSDQEARPEDRAPAD